MSSKNFELGVVIIGIVFSIFLVVLDIIVRNVVNIVWFLS